MDEFTAGPAGNVVACPPVAASQSLKRIVGPMTVKSSPNPARKIFPICDRSVGQHCFCNRLGEIRPEKHLSAIKQRAPVEAAAQSPLIQCKFPALGRAVSRGQWVQPANLERRAPGGGCIIAILGVDGSGKSTSVTHLLNWLQPKMDVMPIYFGTGDGRPSMILWPFKLLLPFASRLLGRRPWRASFDQSGGTPKPAGFLFSAMLTVWAIAVAIEKRHKLRSASRAARRGLIVIADRFPQDQVPDFNDGPLLSRFTAIPKWLRRFESNSYALSRRLAPDLVIKLIARPDTIARREPGLHSSNIPGRIADLLRLDFPRSRVVCIDGQQQLPDMIRAIQQEVWRQI